MNTMRGSILGVLAIGQMGMTGVANAALTSIDSGQAVYDSTENISWVADANLASTSGYAPGGLMTWSQAWIASLNSASYLGVSDWRLPTNAQPDATCSKQYG